MENPDPLVPRALLDGTVRLLTELCEISSASGDAKGIRAIADRLAAALARHGLSSEIRMERDGGGLPQPLLLARGPTTGPTYLLLVSHLDTVLPAIAPRRDGDHLIATGALDTKGSLAALVGALELIAIRGTHPPSDLLLLAVPDEEASGAISAAALAHWGGKSRAMLVLEPGEGRGEAETIVAGRRGLTEWVLDVRGRASHSGLAYWEGRSAVAAASDWCTQALQLSKPGPGVTVNVARLVAGDSDFVDAMGDNFGLLHTSQRRNVVAERAIAEGEVRYLSETSGDTVLVALSELADRLARHHGVEMLFTPGDRVHPVEASDTGKTLVHRAVEMARSRGWELLVEDDRGGISFPNYVAEIDRIPTIDGLGPVGGCMHTREEYVSLRSLERRIVLLADLLETL